MEKPETLKWVETRSKPSLFVKESCPGLSVTRDKDDGTNGLKSRAWCFTLPDGDDYDIIKLNALKVERLVVGREVGDSGYKHLQGYVRFKDPTRFSWWKTQFPQAHVEVRKGTEYEAAEYCKKEGNVLIDKGYDYDEPRKSMSRDAEAAQIITEIESGMTYGKIRQRHKLFCFWNRNVVLKYLKDEQWYKNTSDDPEI